MALHLLTHRTVHGRTCGKRLRCPQFRLQIVSFADVSAEWDSLVVKEARTLELTT